MEEYLRPITLFSTKFQSYLNQKGATNEVNSKTRYGEFDTNDAFAKALERSYIDANLVGDI
jgi:hypothetical protein